MELGFLQSDSVDLKAEFGKEDFEYGEGEISDPERFAPLCAGIIPSDSPLLEGHRRALSLKQAVVLVDGQNLGTTPVIIEQMTCDRSISG